MGGGREGRRRRGKKREKRKGKKGREKREEGGKDGRRRKESAQLFILDFLSNLLCLGRQPCRNIWDASSAFCHTREALSSGYESNVGARDKPARGNSRLSSFLVPEERIQGSEGTFSLQCPAGVLGTLPLQISGSPSCSRETRTETQAHAPSSLCASTPTATGQGLLRHWSASGRTQSLCRWGSPP